LLTTEGWQRWIRVRAINGLSRYSLRNQWLIAIACHARGITPTYVGGFGAFLALNRCVRKGERAIRILAPCAVKQRDDAGGETGEKRIFSAQCRSSTRYLEFVAGAIESAVGRSLAGSGAVVWCVLRRGAGEERGAATIPCPGARVFAGGGTRGRRAFDAAARQDCGSAEMSTCGACSGACWTSAAARNR